MARTSIRYKQNSKGIEQILKSEETRDVLTGPAERVLSAAKASAPVATGAYRDSLHLEHDTTDRAVVRVVADVPYSQVVEADTGTLARALDAV